MTREELNKKRDEATKYSDLVWENAYHEGFDACTDILLPETDRIRTLHRRECDYSCELRVENKSLRSQLATAQYDAVSMLIDRLQEEWCEFTDAAFITWLEDYRSAMANSGQGDK